MVQQVLLTPLDELRSGQLESACELADLQGIERCTLWHLLLAWELKETGRTQDAQAVMDRLSRKDLWVLREWKAGVALDLLDRIVDENGNRATVAAVERKLVDDEDLPSLFRLLAARGYFAMARDTALRITEQRRGSVG